MINTALDEAKEEALNEEVEDLNVEEADVEEEVEEEIDEVLPQEHKERSNLGRKVAATFEKIDQIGEVLARQQEMIELIGGKDQEVDYEDDIPITKADLKKIESDKKKVVQDYENDFKTVFHTLSEDLPEEDKEQIGALILTDFNLKSTNNGSLDGAQAFQRAKDTFYSKQTPLRHNKVSGVTGKQKVSHKQKPLAKLDKATESYLGYIKRTRGADTAQRLHKEL